MKEGEFKGVELTFMGLNNQNLHNLLFRGFLKPWEAYTGAKITWIDLAQADYNPRLQQAIATGTVDFDIIEMGAPFEGDVCGKGLTSEMPDWVKKQIDIDDYVDYLKPPVGTWNGKTYRVTIDGDCHNFNYRTDYFSDPDLAKAWKDAGNQGEWGVPKTWQQVQAVTKFLKGKKIKGQDALRLSRCAEALGRVRLLFPRQPRHRLRQASGRQGLAVRRRHDEAAHQQSGLGARHPGRDRRAALRARRSDQRRSEHHRLPAVPGRHRLDGPLVGRYRLERQDQRHLGHRRRLRLLASCPGSDDVYNSKTGTWEKLASGPNYAPNWPISAGASTSWPGSTATKQAEGGLERRGPSRRQGSVALDARPIRPASSPTATAISTFREWVAAGYDEAFITSYLNSEVNSYNHPNAAIEPRIPGIFQYYSVAEDELTKIFAGRYDAQTGADNIAAAWEKLTDQIGRDKQIELYKASLGV